MTNSWRNYNINPLKSLKPGVFQGNTGDARIGSIGVIAHESIHSFGLPDLYDTDGEGAGMGKIAVMAAGSHGNSNTGSGWLPSFATGWSRMELSQYFHTNVIDITQDTFDLKLSPIHVENKMYRIPHPDPQTDDYWLIEFRSDRGVNNFDRLIPESGLSISHIADNLDHHHPNDDSKPPARRGESGYGVSLEQKDGKFESQHGSTTINNDLYTTGDEFSPYTLPASTSRRGVPSGIKIHNIRNSGDLVMFDVEFESPPVPEIKFVDYSFSPNIPASIDHLKLSSIYTTLKKSSFTDSTLSITVSTANVPDGTDITMSINPGWITATASITMNNNIGSISIPTSNFYNVTFDDHPDTDWPFPNIITYNLTTGSGARAWSWNDWVAIINDD